jgi:hypothetical protein
LAAWWPEFQTPPQKYPENVKGSDSVNKGKEMYGG